MAITDWPLQERPREKLMHLGPASLSEAELLAIFLQTGTKGKTAIDLARELLGHFKSLTHLFQASPQQLQALYGLGQAKISRLLAALELCRRYLSEDIKENQFLDSASAAKKFLVSKLGNYKQEVFSCIFLNNRHRIIQYKELFFGTLSCAPVYPRVIAQNALECNAGALIIAHNHPSGDIEPSPSDIATTEKLVMALNLFDIRIIDHIIIGGKRSSSFKELGLL